MGSIHSPVDVFSNMGASRFPSTKVRHSIPSTSLAKITQSAMPKASHASFFLGPMLLSSCGILRSQEAEGDLCGSSRLRTHPADLRAGHRQYRDGHRLLSGHRNPAALHFLWRILTPHEYHLCRTHLRHHGAEPSGDRSGGAKAPDRTNGRARVRNC